MNCFVLLRMNGSVLLAGVLLSSLVYGQKVTSDPSSAVTESRPDTQDLPANAGRTAPPALPKGKASLMGGTIRNLDQLRDQLTLQVFGGRRVRVLFDARTLVDRDGKPVLTRDLKPGERVYLETVLENTDIFARRIHVVSKNPEGQANGQIVDYAPEKGELTIRDALSSKPVKMRLSAKSVVLHEGRTVPVSELQEGALVSAEFLPSGGGGEPVVIRISIIAKPGASFTFSGRVVHLDLHTGLLVLLDPRDGKNYEISFDPALVGRQDELREGVDVTANATFDGSRYTARSIVINSVARH